MIKKTIEYTDYFGQKQREDFYFNLNKIELAEMEISEKGGMSAKLERLVKSQDNKEIVQTFKEIILASYGVRSEDGKRFVKSQQAKDEFTSTAAFVELFMELATNEQAAIEFVNGLIPEGLDKNPQAPSINQPQDFKKKQVPTVQNVSDDFVQTSEEPKVESPQEMEARIRRELSGQGEM